MKRPPDPFRGEVATLPEQFTRRPEVHGELDHRGPWWIAGLGGSGLAGELTAALMPKRVGSVIRDERLPEDIPQDAAVLCVSFSGNTGETLRVWDAARERGLPTAAVASGGALLERARTVDAPHAIVPTGCSPRSSLGYLVRGCAELAHVERDPEFWETARRHLEHVCETWETADATGVAKAGELAEALLGTLPALLFTGRLGAIAAHRWVADLAENAQVPALEWRFPEASHNAIQTVAASAPRLLPIHMIALESSAGEAERARFETTIGLLEETGVPLHRVGARHADPWIEAVGLCYIGDWVSVALAERLEVDAGDLAIMNALKSRLGQTP